MEVTWTSLYDNLVKYVAEHPSIRIRPKTVIIMGEERDEFFRQLDAIKKQFVIDNFNEQLIKSNEMVAHYNEAKDEILASGIVNEIVLGPRLEPFMQDPLYAFSKILTNPLMDVFQTNLTIENFESESLKKVQEEFEFCYKYGYERYIALKLIIWLDGDYISRVFAPDSQNDSSILDGIATAYRKEDLIDGAKTKRLDFELTALCGFYSSRMIVHSRRFNRFVALRSDWYEPRWASKRHSPSQQWIKVSDIEYNYGKRDLYPDMFIYVADDVRDLTLSMDLELLCIPHIIIDFEETDDWFEQKGLSSIKRHAIVTQPKCGSIVVSLNDFNKESVDEAIKPMALADNFKVEHPHVDIITTLPEVDDSVETQIDENCVDEVVLSEATNASGPLDSSLVDNEHVATDISYQQTTAYQEYVEHYSSEDELQPMGEIVDASIQTQESVDENQQDIDQLEDTQKEADADELEEVQEEAKPVEMEPELNIKVLNTGWDLTSLEEVLTEMITPIPPYPPAIW